MKKFSVICAAFCLVSSFPLFSQNKTVFHYPLNDGDLWEYWEGPRFFLYDQRKVIGDTLLSNSQSYKIIEIVSNRGYGGLMFQRVEDQCVFQAKPRFIPPDSTAYDEFLLYKLEVEIGDSWPHPGPDYDGFLADSGFVQVNEFGSLNFGGRSWNGVAFASYTLPDTGLWFHSDVILLDSLGVYSDAYDGGYLQLRGAIINGKQFGTLTSVSEREAAQNAHIPIVTSFRIFPNPVVSGIQIQFALNHPDEIQFAIFDILGRELYQAPPRHFGVGLHNLPWGAASELDKATLSSGVYFLVLNTGLSQQWVHRFTVVR